MTRSLPRRRCIALLSRRLSRETAFSNALAVSMRTAGIAKATRRLASLINEVILLSDIETKVGLTGGHIFQGECLPPFMWEKRLTARTPMPGFYLCGACTHPGGSVIGVNGRNAAMAVLRDLGKF